MIISRTPLRMSFVGGGSDLPAFYHEQEGAVVSTAIDKYVYVTINPKFDQRVRISYSKTEEAASVDRIKHPLVRAALKEVGITGGVEITSIADIPSRGTGLGSSSSFTVGLLHVLHVYQGRYRSAEQLARESCVIEIERCGEPIGKQDQYAAAYGGFNFIRFLPDESVQVEPIVCRRETMQRLQESLITFYTGITRRSGNILREKQRVLGSSKRKQHSMAQMVRLAHELRKELQNNRLDAFGEMLHQNWLLKKSISEGISNSMVDRWYETARQHGALGGKLLGAGAGGFMTFYAPPQRHDAIRRALRSLREVPMRFEPLGSRIIFVH